MSGYTKCSSGTIAFTLPISCQICLGKVNIFVLYNILNVFCSDILLLVRKLLTFAKSLTHRVVMQKLLYYRSYFQNITRCYALMALPENSETYSGS